MDVIEIKIDAVRADAKLIEEASANPAKVRTLPITIISGSDNPDRYDVEEHIETQHYSFGTEDETPVTVEKPAASTIEIPLVPATQEAPVPELPAVPTVPEV